MALNVTRQAGQACSTRQTTSARLAQYRSARSVSFVCQAQQSSSHDVSISRREIFLASVLPMAAAAGLVNPALALADGEEEYVKLIGYATPPTSYGGYGGNAAETPRYTFEYPAGWKVEQPNKVEKGTQGVDSRVTSPKGREFKAFVITLARAGEDGARFKLTDLDSTLSSFAGADYDIQDAISGAINKTTSKREADGNEYYEYDIESSDKRYLSSIAVKNGKVFALFVRSPAKSFQKNEAKLRHILDSFTLL